MPLHAETVSIVPVHVAPQPEAGYSHAPDALHPVAPQVPPVVQVAAQQLPVPVVPHALLVH
jgi:hypothetical protein